MLSKAEEFNLHPCTAAIRGPSAAKAVERTGREPGENREREQGESRERTGRKQEENRDRAGTEQGTCPSRSRGMPVSSSVSASGVGSCLLCKSSGLDR